MKSLEETAKIYRNGAGEATYPKRQRVSRKGAKMQKTKVRRVIADTNNYESSNDGEESLKKNSSKIALRLGDFA
jgi:hypothetical protein